MWDASVQGPNCSTSGASPLTTACGSWRAYRLGSGDRESAGTGESLLEAHAGLRARILFDRIRFGFSDLVDRR